MLLCIHVLVLIIMKGRKEDPVSYKTANQISVPGKFLEKLLEGIFKLGEVPIARAPIEHTWKLYTVMVT